MAIPVEVPVSLSLEIAVPEAGDEVEGGEGEEAPRADEAGGEEGAGKNTFCILRVAAIFARHI